MNPVNNVNNASSHTGAISPSQSGKRDSADWFSLSGIEAGETLSATPLFDAGTTVEEISSQILSHISEPDSP